MRGASTTTRVLRLLSLLLRRDEAGQPLPALLSDLRRLYQGEGSEDAAALKLQRDLRAIGAVFAIRRQGEGSGAAGRAPAELVRVWVLLPGEAVVL